MSKFKPGRSGNPNGRPRGARSTVTALRKELISDGDLQAIVDVVIGKAKAGDLAAAGMILDRRLPRLKVTADFGLERDNLAEQLKEARERVSDWSRPVLFVSTGVDGGLAGGENAPECEHPPRAETPAPPPASRPSAAAVADARNGFETTTHAGAREDATAFCQPLKGATEQTTAPVSAGIARVRACETPPPPPALPAAQAIRLRPMTSAETGADFDPYREE